VVPVRQFLSLSLSLSLSLLFCVVCAWRIDDPEARCIIHRYVTTYITFSNRNRAAYLRSEQLPWFIVHLEGASNNMSRWSAFYISCRKWGEHCLFHYTSSKTRQPASVRDRTWHKIPSSGWEIHEVSAIDRIGLMDWRLVAVWGPRGSWLLRGKLGNGSLEWMRNEEIIIT
jgi:hypothetical protein